MNLNFLWWEIFGSTIRQTATAYLPVGRERNGYTSLLSIPHSFAINRLTAFQKARL